ncbi:MAG: ABC transporter substrate binding protein [Chloroflexi bacterium]|nr:ABC transporter substrate binding protein [Chloroflexota bacterium]
MLRFLITMSIMLLLGAPALAQQDQDKLSVWLISFYPFGPTNAIQTSLLDTLETYGLINPEDRSDQRMQVMIESADNSPIQFNRLDANFELGRLRELVAFALDHEPDALVTISAPVTLAALLATEDMDDPPAIFFTDVYNPYEAGIADAPCIKPAHVSGVQSVIDYEAIVALLPMQNPDIQTIGSIHNSADASGVYGAEQIAAAGASLGLTVEQAAVTSLADLALATGGLVSKGVEAILLPMDYMAMAGLPLISGVANDQGIPVIFANLDGMVLGATVGAGFSQFLEVGDAVGLMVAAHLAGELDPASAGISAQAGDMVVGINLHTAEQMGFSFSQALQERADMSLTMNEEAGLPSIMPISEAAQAAVGAAFFGGPMPLEARQERDQAFLAGLECTPERIAEQQAELDARDG